MSKLTPIEHKNQRVLTTQQLAEGYGTDAKVVRNNFSRNSDRYLCGTHFFILEGKELQEFRATHQIEVLPNVNSIYLWTEKGALLHAKSLNTDKAWDVYNELVDTYFRKKEVTPPLQIDSKFMFLLAAQLEEKEKKILELTPAAEFGNAVSNNNGGILVRDYVKVLANDGITITQDKFFSWLHVNGYIYRQKGYKEQWIPYKQYVEQGLFRIKETPLSSSSHGDWISITIKVTGKGQKYFYEKLKKAA